MKLNGFLGGNDVQRSLNLADSRCVNLYHTTNDDGSVGALVSTPGLTLEVTNPADAISTGIYTASNGRAFEVAGTTLYELTEAAGVISTTSRGTVTAGITKFSDNGIDMVLVNGTDGWTFTFATNALKKITVKQAEFTVTIASPAVFTKIGHGLVAGDVIQLSTTGDYSTVDGVLTALAPSSITTGGVSYGPIGICISNDGTSVYAINGNASDSIAMFSRNTTTGALTALSPATIAAGTGGPQSLAISPDGLSVYVAGLVDNNIRQYSRNLTTGALTALAPATIAVTDVAQTVTVSPDGAHVYAAVINVGIAMFSRDTSTGALTALAPATIAAGVPLSEIIVSPDGAHVYLVDNFNNVIRQFSRNASTGQLATLTPSTVAAVMTASGVVDGIAISPDGLNVYVSSYSDDYLLLFSRDTTTGLLTALSPTTIETGNAPIRVTVSADNASVYVTNNLANTVSHYIRNATTGVLYLNDTYDTAVNPYGVAVTNDGNSVYVCNYPSSSVSMYSRSAASTTVYGLPTGLETLTDYYIIAAGLTADAFEVSETLGGTSVNTSGTQAGTHTYTTIGYGFPEGCKTISYCNGRFIACEPNTQNFYCSDVLDAFRWDALNVQTADAFPDDVTCEVVSHNEVIVFSENSGEVFYDSGTYPSPFVRNSSGIFSVGCTAPYSIAEIDNSIFWLGQGKAGNGIIYRMIGYTPQRISSYSVEYAIQGMSDITDAVSFAYQQNGHHFFYIVFPTGNKSFCYDLNTGFWHERASFADGSFLRWEATHYAYAFGKHLVTDNAEGKIYSMALDVYADGAAVHKWLRSWRCPDTGMKRVRHSMLEIHLEAGVGVIGEDEPTIMLKWSDDGGHTWSNEVWRNIGIGSLGEYSKRVVFYRLGMTSGQPRIYELSGSAAVKTVLLNAYLE